LLYTFTTLEDSKFKRRNQPLNYSYNELISNGTVIPIQTQHIVTMDRPSFFPARYKEVNDSKKNVVYLPIVDQFSVNSEYIDFLNRASDILGNPKMLL